jgi:hypothetical protein
MLFRSAQYRMLGKGLPALFFIAVLCGGPMQTVFAHPQNAENSGKRPPVFVNDFELNSVPLQPSPSSTEAKKQKSEQQSVYEESSAPSIQARRLIDFFSSAVVQAMQKGGYAAARLQGKSVSKGALVRGVFAEPDPKNRIRRSLLGGGSPNPKFFLYVGIFNLARPDQPLYELATIQEADSRYGPIITLNSYIPLAKYELEKNPTEDEVRRISSQIVSDLEALLRVNPNAFVQ